MVEVAAMDADFAENDRLFHYTNSAGLYGILTCGCLWATHYRFLNDSSELFSVREALITRVAREIHRRAAALKVNREVTFVEGVNLQDVSVQEATVIVDAMYSTTIGDVESRVTPLGHPYVFSSFCCAASEAEDFGNGVLVHWGTYGRGGGYAVQFNPHKIKGLLAREQTTFTRLVSLSRKVTYLTEAPNADLSRWIDKIADVGRKIVEAELRGKDVRDVDVSGSLEPFINAITCSKNSFFAPEREARIVIVQPDVPSPDHKDHEIHMRHSAGMSIPFIKIFADTLLGEHCPIERILVGPHPDNSRRVIALKTFLKGKGLDHIQVDVSKVPYITQLA